MRDFHKDAVEQCLLSSRTKKEYQRVLCVWLRVGLSLSAPQIAVALGMTPVAVRKFHSRYFKQGALIFAGSERGGRTRAYISREREIQLLSKFRRQAQRGQSLNVKQIKHAYELSAGRKVAGSTIYRMIDRHGMRRFLPRARKIAM